MARCPLCSERSAKRFCPANQVKICSVCCGSKREVEIDCPSMCPYLQLGRLYEAEKRPVDPALAARVQPLTPAFLEEFSPVINALTIGVFSEREEATWLVDADVLAVYQALAATLRTLDSGIYYESIPDGRTRASLFQRLRRVLQEFMEPRSGRPLRVSEALQVMDFMLFTGTVNSNPRPKSRQYLDWIAEVVANSAPSEERSSRLILP